MNPRQVFVASLRREEVPYTPIWLMRQAGRYLPEYRAVREKHSFLEMCRTPELAVEVTLQPLRRFELDAAILFSDILIPLPPMGLKLEFFESKGPQIENPVSSMKDVENLRVANARQDTGFVGEAVRMLRKELGDEKALIGFAGAPFTLASYAVEGGHSKDYAKVKKMMWNQPEAFRLLLEKITDTVIDYLKMQLEEGADAVQVFDSWIGALTPMDFKEFAFPYLKRIFEELKQYNKPTIYFGTMTSGFFNYIKELGSNAVGVDWRINIDDAWKIIGDEKAIQGNLDPMVLYADREVIRKHAKDVLDRASSFSGHVFNLGHGLTPQTPIDSVAFLVDFVHEESEKIRNSR
ncbi:MAG: uroporphyrinogen decarboxylase [Actinobacteria bacterium]|nr:uroporphyrinogen decarboxylase [Actinomycetota bacterium]